MQDYAEAVQAARDLYDLVASSYYPNWRTPMQSTPEGTTKPTAKLTMQDLAIAAHEAYQSAPQDQRWHRVVEQLIERINDHLPVTLAMHADGEVTVDVTSSQVNTAPDHG